MELGTQIKKYRQEKDWSQETLAEKTYVSRQTISNWENDKSYPDIQSLLLLSTLFDVSLDQLVKGDVETMKDQVTKEDMRKFNRSATILAIMYLVVLISAIPLIFNLRPYGLFIWLGITAVAFGYAIYVERKKKQYDVQTYREILAFMNGDLVDEIRKSRDGKKLKKEKVIMFVACAIIGAALAIISYVFFVK